MNQLLKFQSQEGAEDSLKSYWETANPKQKAFFLEYLKNGCNATKAYREIYNRNASLNVAKSSGSRMLASVNLSGPLDLIKDFQYSDILRARQVFLEAMEAQKPLVATRIKVDKDGHKTRENYLIKGPPDHNTRIHGASSMVNLLKLMGCFDNNAQDEPPHQNTTINSEVLTEMNQYLKRIGQKGIE